MTPRFFNTAGPVDCTRHYCIPPLERFNLPEILQLIEQQKYFVLHAPRQTGKTTYLLALMDYLNQQGTYHALYVNVEIAQAAQQNVAQGMRAILSQIAAQADLMLQDQYPEDHWAAILDKRGEHAALQQLLSLWARQSAKPLILLIDEIDSLVGNTLVSVLRQLRAGYPQRPQLFPQSIVLCGVRDVRDYRLQTTQEPAIITGGSAFNIKAESLRLDNFNPTDINSLYQQHTTATGQLVEEAALTEIWRLTRGQPWLVNALGYEICFRLEAGRHRAHPITADMVLRAKEQLILRRETHLDQLVDKLRENRVRNVIEPLLSGLGEPELIPTDDIAYVQDLGLIRLDDGQLNIANPIYQEIIPRELTYSTQLTIAHPSAWYIQPAGRLDMDKLLEAFQQFFRQHSEHWVERFEYKEAGPQLLLQAFLQRIINSGGQIEREYGLGRKRTDLLLIWPYSDHLQKVVIELKLLYGPLDETITAGLAQTWQYMDRCGSDEGHLVIFDRDETKPWAKKIFRRNMHHHHTPITVWGM